MNTSDTIIIGGVEYVPKLAATAPGDEITFVKSKYNPNVKLVNVTITLDPLDNEAFNLRTQELIKEYGLNQYGKGMTALVVRPSR